MLQTSKSIRQHSRWLLRHHLIIQTADNESSVVLHKTLSVISKQDDFVI